MMSTLQNFLNERFGKYGTWVDKTFSKKLEI